MKNRDTENKRKFDNLFRDVMAFDQDDIIRFLRSGFEYEESLEYMRLMAQEGNKQ